MLLPTKSWTPVYVSENEEECRRYLQAGSNHSNMDEIPLLDSSRHCEELNQKLVIFRGMIQDMGDPIMYLNLFSVRNKDTGNVSIRSSKYTDSIIIKDNEEVLEYEENSSFMEKKMLHCVTVPGLNCWHWAVVGKLKNMSMCCEEDLAAVSINHNYENNPTSSHYSSISLGVSLIVYDDNVQLLLNDVVEAIGFLSYQTAPDEDSEGYCSPMRLHVIHITSAYSIFKPLRSDFSAFVNNHVTLLREELWIMLTDIFLGDTLAADYFICNLISSVYMRSDASVLGTFTLNISNLPNFKYALLLNNFISHLLEKSVYLPLTTSNLNNMSMIPEKNIEHNRLITGTLQLSDNTHLIIDETKMAEGQLSEKGLKNLQCLSKIILNQVVYYDFQVYQLPFQTNIPVLILSIGKSLLPNDAQLVLDPDSSCIQNIEEAFQRSWKKLSEPLLTRLRIYLNCISFLDYNVSSEIKSVIENSMVEMRKSEGPNRVTIDDLHKLMLLSRLMSISKGLHSLSKEIWDYTIQMESHRKNRL